MLDDLYDVTLRLGLQWKIGGVMQSPTRNDLERVLDRAKEVLYSEPIPSQIELPGLLVRRTDTDTFTVYVSLGDIP